MSIKPRYQVALLLFFVLGVYYPTLFGEFITVDDHKLINRILNMESYDWWNRLNPGSSFYYRPLLVWTYYLDKQLWGLEPGFMHLVNMVLHAVNAVLVFFIARRTCIALFGVIGLLPLVAALLFALHPINTESVNWVSGRTDLLATSFVLGATLLLIHAIESRRAWWGLLAALVFIAGIMSKEVVLFFLPLGCYLLWRWPTGAGEGSHRSLRLRSIFYFAVPFVAGATAYIVMRFARFGGSDSGVNFIINNFSYDLLNTVRVVFKVFGFYVKKLFMPLPLNFAITSAHDAYVWLGIIAVIILIVLAWFRHLAADFLLIALMLIVPAIIIALTNVAWTPLAERYLYLSSAFWAVAVVAGVYQVATVFGKPLVLGSATAVVLAGMGWVTYERNIIWQTNLTLFEDTVHKNPGFPPVRNELASALLRAGRHDESMKQLAFARGQDSGQRVLNVHFNTVRGMIRDGNFEAVWSEFMQVQSSVERRTRNYREEVVIIFEAMLRNFPEDEHKQLIMPELLTAYDELMKRNSDPFLRYRAGQIAMHLGQYPQAVDFFTEAYQRAPASAHYKAAAGRLAMRLAENEN